MNVSVRKTTILVTCLFLLSGFSGLVYELVWIRLLSHLLGGTTFAISTVLAAFMGGLALGSFYFGRRIDANPQPLRLYAWLELGIVVGGGLVPVLIHLLQPLYVAAAHTLPGPALGLLRVLVAMLLILPPTILMGGTLPVLSRFIVRRADRLGRGLGMLYAVNTLGAVLGAFLSGFVLIPAFGLIGSTGIAMAGNLVAGLGALLLWKFTGHAVSAEPTPTIEPTSNGRAASPELNLRLLTGIFALSGFAALGFELYWSRALHHFLGNSTFAFSAMLTTFLCGLAGGGWLGGRLADRVSSPAQLLGRVQAGVALSAAATVPLIWNWLPGLEDTAFFSGRHLGWSTYLGRRFLACFVVMLVPTFLSGMTFPLVNRIGIAGLNALGRDVGRFYFANTTGSIVGSLVAGFVLLPLLGARNALLATAVLSAVLAVVVLTTNTRRRKHDSLPALIVLALLLATAIPLSRQARPLLSDTQDPVDVVLFDREDPTAHTRVYHKPNGEMHMSVDGHHIGGTEPTITRKEKILAHLPMALVPEARNTLSVGLGSGVTLGTLALYDEIRRLVCVEIVPGVIAGASSFRDHNNNVMNDTRVEMIQGDGIQYLLTTTGTFDVISSDSKLNPAYAGNSAILSRDYYELCAERLTPRGVMVQWLAIHFPQVEMRTVYRSFVQAFPHVELFWIDPNNVVLVGALQPLVLDFDRARSLHDEEDVLADLQQQMLDDPYVLAGNRVAGRERLLGFLGKGTVNTWLRPVLEFSVVRQFLLKATLIHENDNYRLLDGLWDETGLAVTGDHDPQMLDRFNRSSRQLLLGYGSGGGGGSNSKTGGQAALSEGLEINPDDHRLTMLQDMFQADQRRDASVRTEDLSDPTVLQNRALRALDAQRPAEALAAVERALESKPDDAELHYTRLLALRRLQRWDEAEAAGRDYVEAHSQDPRGPSLLGIILGETGRYEEALIWHRRSVDQDPHSAKYLNNLAITESRLERWPEAAAAFARVAELEPALPGAAFYASACYSMAEQTGEAARWMAFCLEHGLGEAEQFIEYGYFINLRESGDWDEEDVRRALENGSR